MKINVWTFKLTDSQRVTLGQCLNHVRGQVQQRIDRAPDVVDNLSARIAREQIDDLINLFDVSEIK